MEFEKLKEQTVLPSWYNEAIHNNVLMFLQKGNKLHAVKYLCDLSSQNGTREVFGLKEAKFNVVDKIGTLEAKNSYDEAIHLLRCVLTDSRTDYRKKIYDFLKGVDELADDYTM